MIAYWKITFTIALAAVFVGAIDRYTPFKCKIVRDLIVLVFMTFVCIGMSVEVWG